MRRAATSLMGQFRTHAPQQTTCVGLQVLSTGSDARAHLPAHGRDHRIDLHSIDDNSFCLDTDRRCSTASRSIERDSAGIEPGQCDGREPPIGLGAEERMVDTKAVEVVVEEGDRLV
jgi:hypothetical protein